MARDGDSRPQMMRMLKRRRDFLVTQIERTKQSGEPFGWYVSERRALDWAIQELECLYGPDAKGDRRPEELIREANNPHLHRQSVHRHGVRPRRP